MMRRILIVHAYEVYEGGVLGVLAETVCAKAARIHQDYTHIFLVGGWHLKELGARPTLGECMKERLLQLGVPANKLHTQFSLATRLQRFMPPRDTMEEVDIVPQFLRAIGEDPPAVGFDALGVWYFVPRIRFLYQSRGAHARVKGAFSWKTLLMLRRIYFQFVGYRAARKDSLGRSAMVGKARLSRTADKSRPYLPNLPSAWK